MTPETTIAPIAPATADVEAVEAPAVSSEPVNEPHTSCAQCGRAFDWRDELYAHASVSGRCKRCAQRRAVRTSQRTVAFHPATRTVKAPGEKPRDVLITHNRTARRGHGAQTATAPFFDPAIAPKSRKPTRAERRAKARKAAANSEAGQVAAVQAA